MERRFTASTVALLAYAAAMTAYVYGFEHRPDADRTREIGVDEVAVFSSVALLHLALGAVVARWLVLLAPSLPVLIALPAGDYPGGWPENPVAASIFLQEAVYGLPLVALGVLARWLLDHRRGAASLRSEEH